jgi:hypothetical protein
LATRSACASTTVSLPWVAQPNPQGEKDLDPERKGGAIIIDLDSIKGLEADGNFFVLTQD